jgi:4-hydroxyproline epimerase
MNRICVIDSHTGGEPTRLVLDGGPELGDGPLAERVQRFREHFDSYRSALVNEPRGSDVVVGALLTRPHSPGCQYGVIFFNNVGYLGMCGHGTIGVIASLAHIGAIAPGAIGIDTPAGRVGARLHDNGEVSVENVPSYRTVRAAAVEVEGFGVVRGDIAWGGNWFYLISEHGQHIDAGKIDSLVDFTWRIRRAVNAQVAPEVDHVELFAPASDPNIDSRNFVLCPGKAYDRSPCGTGTSAKLACLAADGELAEGEPWVQQSIIGSTFTAHYRWLDRSKGHIIPTIKGSAHVTAEAVLRLDPNDPYCWGIRT